MLKCLTCITAAFLIMPPAYAEQSTPEPNEHPSWADVRIKGEKALRADLYDPSGAELTWVEGFSWSSVKSRDLFTKRASFWVGCATLNAKNRFGGFVGPKAYAVWVSVTGDVVVGSTFEVSSKCDRTGPGTPLQPELVAASEVAGSSSIDQLSKLASLLEKGLISRGEFDREKAQIMRPTP